MVGQDILPTSKGERLQRIKGKQSIKHSLLSCSTDTQCFIWVL